MPTKERSKEGITAALHRCRARRSTIVNRQAVENAQRVQDGLLVSDKGAQVNRTEHAIAAPRRRWRAPLVSAGFVSGCGRAGLECYPEGSWASRPSFDGCICEATGWPGRTIAWRPTSPTPSGQLSLSDQRWRSVGRREVTADAASAGCGNLPRAQWQSPRPQARNLVSTVQTSEPEPWLAQSSILPPTRLWAMLYLPPPTEQVPHVCSRPRLHHGVPHLLSFSAAKTDLSPGLPAA